MKSFDGAISSVPETWDLRGHLAIPLVAMVVTSCSALGCGNYYAFSFPSVGVALEDKGRIAVRGGGTLATGEKGDMWEHGQGLAAEGRLFDFLMLPPSTASRFRFAGVTLGARFTAFSLYHTGTRSTGTVNQMGNIVQYTPGPDITVDYQVLGVGAFLRGSPASWTVHLGADPGGAYDPYFEAGLWARASLPTMLGPGIELSVGGAGSRDVGALLFGTLNILLGQQVVCKGQEGC
jgi:hypothetical protein